MKKRQILIALSVLIIGIFFYYLKYIYGWLEVRNENKTPKEFLNNTIIEVKKYSSDSVQLLQQLNTYRKNHYQSFHSNTYFDSTELILDTILYSPDFNKIALFVLAKNPTHRQLMPDKDHDWYYDAFCYLALRKVGIDSFDLKWVKNYYPVNWYDKDEIIRSVRYNYFNEFSEIKDRSGQSIYKYNLNDRRFWNSPAWTRYFDDSE